MITVRDLVMRLPSGGRSLAILGGVRLEIAAGEGVAGARPSGSGQCTRRRLPGGRGTAGAGALTMDGVGGEPPRTPDSSTGAQIVDVLLARNRQRGSTLVLVTHDLALAARAGRAIALRDGRLVNGHHPR